MVDGTTGCIRPKTKARQQSAAACYRWEPVGFHKHTGGGVPCLSGRVLFGVRTCHIQRGYEVRGGRLTMATCHSALRRIAVPGDVVLLVSPSNSAGSATRGINTSQRIVLMAFIVETTLSIPRYYATAAPRWATGRRDRIYSVSAVTPKKSMRHRRRIMDVFMRDTDGQSLLLAALKKVNCRTWHVEYAKWPGVRVRFTRKTSRRMLPIHSVRGLNSVDLAQRARDFHGRILTARRFAIFSGDSADRSSVIFDSLKTHIAPGRGVRVASLGTLRHLRHWVAETLLCQ